MTNFIVTGNNAIKRLVFLCVYKRNGKLCCTCSADVKIRGFLVKDATRLFEIGVLKYSHFDCNSPTRIQ